MRGEELTGFPTVISFSISGANHWYTVGFQRVHARQCNDLAERDVSGPASRPSRCGLDQLALECALWTRRRSRLAVDPVDFGCVCSMSAWPSRRIVAEFRGRRTPPSSRARPSRAEGGLG